MATYVRDRSFFSCCVARSLSHSFNCGLPQSKAVRSWRRWSFSMIQGPGGLLAKILLVPFGGVHERFVWLQVGIIESSDENVSIAIAQLRHRLIVQHRPSGLH